MDSQIEATPASLNIGELVGYSSINNNIPGLLGLTFLGATSIGGFDFRLQASLLTVLFPNLKQVTGVGSLAGNVAFPNNLVLNTVSAPVLESVKGSITVSSNPALTVVALPELKEVFGGISVFNSVALAGLNLPKLVTISGPGGLNASVAIALTTVALPNYLPTNARPQNFGGCALTQASVDHVLARCVASADYVSGFVTLNGGTNAAPGTQGQIDKAILISRGVMVATN